MGRTVPRVGRLLVHHDGSVDVGVEIDDSPDSEATELREAALRYGWGEPLLLVRRGSGAHGAADSSIRKEPLAS